MLKLTLVRALQNLISEDDFDSELHWRFQFCLRDIAKHTPLLLKDPLESFLANRPARKIGDLYCAIGGTTIGEACNCASPHPARLRTLPPSPSCAAATPPCPSPSHHASALPHPSPSLATPLRPAWSNLPPEPVRLRTCAQTRRLTNASPLQGRATKGAWAYATRLPWTSGTSPGARASSWRPMRIGRQDNDYH
jgi:hypothetical protein